MSLGERIISDVNFHMTPLCNMSCKFCFAQFKNVKPLGKYDTISLVRMISDEGFRKVNFVGGEPTLVPWLKEAIIEARNRGLITSIITNGWNMNKDWLDAFAEHLDWIGLSIDSLHPDINSKLGRKVPSLEAPSFSSYLDSVNLVHEYNVNLKINTVVNQLNKTESFHEIIREGRPEKWKIFQVLVLENENPEAIKLSITRNEFKEFLARHSELSRITNIYPEYNDDMRSSYLIIDPAGRFVDNSSNKYHYSDSILDIGVKNALNQVLISKKKFELRHDSERLQNILTEVMI